MKKIFPNILIIFLAVCINIFTVFAINNIQDIRKRAYYSFPRLSLVKPIEITTVDSNSAFYGTFQSHNQKVVSNKYGIFMTYLKTQGKNMSTDLSTWRLMRSTDGGKTFSTFYEASYVTNPPAIETDINGTIYLFHPDLTKSDAYLYRFSSSNGFQNPAITNIPNGAYGGAGKFATAIDEKRNQLYYFSHNGYFNTIGMDGQVKKTTQLVGEGVYSYLAYPELYLDIISGDLYAAWTTQKKEIYMYRSIHIMKSKDGGITWTKLDGTSLIPPIIPDDGGPTDQVSLNSEYDVHTYLWSIVVKDGKIHLPYEAQFNPVIQHYVRYDTITGKKDLDITPVWKGNEISLMSLDGFCATKNQVSGFPVYCTSVSYSGGKSYLATLVSFDKGQTWTDYASIEMGAGKVARGAYAIGGAREISDDGYIMGSFTDATINSSAVDFFKIQVETSNNITPSEKPVFPILNCLPLGNNTNCDFKTIRNNFRLW